VLSLALACAFAPPAAAQEAAPCRQALALGLDVSGSVDAREYRLQTDGLADALDHPEVRAALLQAPGAPVHLAVFEWSGSGAQRVLADWTAITDAGALATLRARLRGMARAQMPVDTALGEAKRFGLSLLGRRADCWKRTLDLSGDGESNAGERPEAVAVPPGVTVNGLVIGETSLGPDGPVALEAYYRARVIAGPGAFVERAEGFDTFRAAMVRKLLRELEGVVVSAPADLPGARLRSVADGRDQ
jgi:hypothetical protein